MGKEGPREVVKQERGRKGSNLQSGDSPTQTVQRSTLHSPTPSPSLSQPNAPGRTPTPTPDQTNECQVLGAEALPGARSRCFRDLETTPHSAGHAPGTCPQPLPPGWLRSQARMALDSSHTPTSGLWRVPGVSGPCSPRPLNDPPSFLPVTAMARPASPPVPAHLILVLAQQLE